MTVVLDNRTARRRFLALHGLADPPRRALSPAGLLVLVERLGFVQVDSINTLTRAHHHIVFARNQTYRPADLARLIERDGLLFENWTHDASIIPSAFYPYWRHRFVRERARLKARWKTWRRDPFLHECETILERIARDGPVMARDFEAPKRRTAGWWDWHPSKTALEYLWRTGELAIARREGFQKVYDLPERVIAAAHLRPRVDDAAFVDWACRSALARLGFATRGEIARFWDLLRPEEVAVWMEENAAGLRPVTIETTGGVPRQAVALADAAETLAEPVDLPGRVRALSPFDPALRDRARAERLFGFRYRIEVFVPEARRQYGYYVFPMLRGDRLVGRIDMKAVRERDALCVRRFWPERGVRVSAALLDGIDGELDRLARFAGVSTVRREDGWVAEAQ